MDSWGEIAIFFRSNIKYLGQIIDANMRGPNPSSRIVIKKKPCPKKRC